MNSILFSAKVLALTDEEGSDSANTANIAGQLPFSSVDTNITFMDKPTCKIVAIYGKSEMKHKLQLFHLILKLV